MNAREALVRLEGLRNARGQEAAAAKKACLAVLARRPVGTARAVERLHEALCFLRAYPDDAEVQAAYDSNRKSFEVPKQYQLAQIFIAAPRGDREADDRGKRKLDEVLRRLKQKGDFAAVARELSDERDAAQRGGEIGWLSEDQIVVGIRTTAVGLAKGALSEPVRLDDGWHVLKLVDTRPPTVRSLAEVRTLLVAQMRAERARANRQAYLAKLLDQNPPAINELNLSKILAKAK